MKLRVNGGVFGVRQPVTFPQRADARVSIKTVECDGIEFLHVRDFKAAFVEMTQPPVPHLGTGNCIHRDLVSCVAMRAEV